MKLFFKILTGLGITLAVVVPLLLTLRGYDGLGMLLIFIAFMEIYLLGLIGSGFTKEEVSKKYNKKTTAEIIKVEEMGVYVNHQPQLSITVSYVLENGYKAVNMLKKVVTLVELSRIQPGEKIDILYQEDKPYKIIPAPEVEREFEGDLGEFNFVVKETPKNKIDVFIGSIAIVLGFIALFGSLAIIFVEDRTGVLNITTLVMCIIVILLGIVCVSFSFHIFSVICFVGMAALMGLSYFVIHDVSNEYQASEEATAAVLNEYPINTFITGGRQREAKLQYITKDGQKITTTTRSKNATKVGIDIEKGGEVTIYYNPANPKKIYFVKKSEEVREPLIYKSSDK